MKRNRKLITLRLVSALELPDWKRVIVRLIWVRWLVARTMSHVEVGQTKVSLAMLLKLAFVLEKNFDYFLLDTPYAKCDSIIDNEIAAKLKKCNVTTLITVGKLIDVLIDQQEMIKKAELD